MKMPKEMKEKWVKALRSGEYTQGRGCLEMNGTYCCLGVLQMVTDGYTERSPGSALQTLPSQQWYEDHGIIDCVMDSTNYLRKTTYTLANMNDGNGPHLQARLSFPQIADWIEENVEGYKTDES